MTIEDEGRRHGQGHTRRGRRRVCRRTQEVNYRPDSDLYIIYNVGTQFASIAPANPPQVRETWDYWCIVRELQHA